MFRAEPDSTHVPALESFWHLDSTFLSTPTIGDALSADPNHHPSHLNPCSYFHSAPPLTNATASGELAPAGGSTSSFPTITNRCLVEVVASRFKAKAWKAAAPVVSDGANMEAVLPEGPRQLFYEQAEGQAAGAPSVTQQPRHAQHAQHAQHAVTDDIISWPAGSGSRAPIITEQTSVAVAMRAKSPARRRSRGAAALSTDAQEQQTSVAIHLTSPARKRSRGTAALSSTAQEQQSSVAPATNAASPARKRIRGTAALSSEAQEQQTSVALETHAKLPARKRSRGAAAGSKDAKQEKSRTTLAKKRQSGGRPKAGLSKRLGGRPPKGCSPYDKWPQEELYTLMLQYHLDHRGDVIGCSKQKFAAAKFGVRTDAFNAKVYEWLGQDVVPRLTDPELVPNPITNPASRKGSTTLDKKRLKEEVILTWERLKAEYLKPLNDDDVNDGEVVPAKRRKRAGGVAAALCQR